MAGYLKDRSGTGASPSTLRVVVATIARNHRDAGFDVPLHQGAPIGPGLLFSRHTSRHVADAVAWSAPECSLLAVIPPQLRHVPSPEIVRVVFEPVAQPGSASRRSCGREQPGHQTDHLVVGEHNIPHQQAD